MEGKSVLFISVPNLIIELKEAMSRSQLTAYKRKFEKYDLVILDELGYETVEVQPVDMFPQTSHIENVVLLNKR